MKITLIASIALAACLPAHAEFVLSSTDIKNGGTISREHVLNDYGCTGGNRSPALAWSGAPKGTRSFAVSVYDPDAPTGSGFWHWVLVNLPPETTALPTGVLAANLPKGSLQTRTDFGSIGYGGPCPPAGDAPHHYQFTVFALDIDKLPVDENSPGALVGFNLHLHTLAKASLVATYGH